MAIPFTSTRSGSCSWRSASIACVGELRKLSTTVTTSPHVSHVYGSTGASTVVPGPSRETILNTIGTCSTVHRMPYPWRCSATESWRVLALSLYQIFFTGSST